MKHLPQVYEKVFSIDRKSSRTKLNLAAITIEDMTINSYISLFHDFLDEAYLNLFNYTVKLSWLRRKFTYYGSKTTLPMYKNSLLTGLAFTKLVRRNIGKDIQIITKSKFFSKIESYFDELFPGFMDGNPFTNPNYYKFPFKNITMDYLIVVSQLEDRVDLLKEADKKKMTFAVFLDYVINYVYSINDELGRDKYQIRHNMDRDVPFYVRDTDKPLRVNNRKKKHER
jgi:hypothetical protein